jgi:hypothetical protein
MVSLSRKTRVLIAATVVVALTFILALPYVYALAPNDPTPGMKTLKAQGIAAQKVDNQTVKSQANFTLLLQPTEANSTVKKFSVFGGTVEVNGVTYTITAGNGAVLTGRHAILLQAQGTGSDEQVVTLKLAGTYFWVGRRLFVVRLVGKLQTGNGNFLLLMRSEIRI